MSAHHDRPGLRLAPDGTPLRVRAPRLVSSAVLSVGAAAAAVAFALASASEVLGLERREASMTDLGAILDGLFRGDPWALASLGIYVVIVTPVIGLLTTAWEYASIGDRRTVLLAGAVLAILAFSVLVAVLS